MGTSFLGTTRKGTLARPDRGRFNGILLGDTDMLINEGDQGKIRELFEKNMKDEVKLVMATHHKSELVLPNLSQCDLCDETEALVKEVAELSPKITAEIIDLQNDEEKARAAGVDKMPGIAVVGARDYGVRYYGMPLQLEFTSLIEDIVEVSKGTTDLADATKQRLAQLTGDIHLQVFVTPQCPYCPRVVRLAHKMAIESDKVRADMVEAMEFPDLAQKYNVMGVPRTIVNDGHGFEGAMPEPLFLLFMLKEAGQLTEAEQEQWKKVEEQLKHQHHH